MLLYSCGGTRSVKNLFSKRTAYEKYEHRLREADLDKTALGKDWIQAGKAALEQSRQVELPYRESGYFGKDEARAISLSFRGRRGEKFVIKLNSETATAWQLFVDLFELREGKEPKHVAAPDSTETEFTYEVKHDAWHVLRIQPELLRSGRYTVSVTTAPTLAFPVKGKDSRNIASFWGDPRDGGGRSHEGIDIFAPRGTPAIAASDGVIGSVRENKLGGKVVFLTDMERRQSLYYAHLDSQLVSAGQRVKTGDTIGLIGNSGNARYTNPHLHFGIYRFGEGATNPLPYVQRSPGEAPAVTTNTNNLGQWVKVSSGKANIRSAPTTNSQVIATLPQNTVFRAQAGTENWYLVQLPDKQTGYISASLVSPASATVTTTPASDEAIFESITAKVVIDSVNQATPLAVIGEFQEYQLVELQNGRFGWRRK
ncbi:MAG: M23 family metallopeptidase [Hymenobacteraceae bacterium]|nr:M23 family metallopeptidase [Hymenobacteraceae bacterium]